MPQNGKLMPNIDQQSTKLLNLTVLQRIDPLVEEILITAAHVTLYQFNIDLTQWSRKDVEGSLFVVKRNMQPRFQFIVMNRRNTDNLVENLLGDFEYEVQVPYLLYRNAAQEVNGIWFYNARECEEVANLFSRILNAYSKVPQKPKVSLSSTKSEFEELEAVPTMAVMDGPLEPSSASASVVSDVPDDPAFVNFFSTAMTIGNASAAAVAGQSYQSSIPIPLHSQLTSVASSTMPTLQIPSPPLSASIPLMPLLDVSDVSSSNNRTANLVKPSFFPRSSFSLALKECQERRPRSEAITKKPDRRRPASLDLNNVVTSSSPRLGNMKKSIACSSRKSGTFPSPGTPNYLNQYHSSVGMQKGWSSERVPLPNNSNRRQVMNTTGAAVLPYNNNGRTLPSKWEDAERWIFSPVSGDGVVRSSIQPAQRRPKSKSGPLGPPGVAYYSLYSPGMQVFDGGNAGNFVAGSPFSAGVIAADGLGIRSHGSHGVSFPMRTEPCMARSVSVHGCSEMVAQSSLPSQDEKLDGVKDAATDISRVVSRRDMATQMSPVGSNHSSPTRKPSFSTSTPSVLPIVELQSVPSSRSETRDVQVDERVTVTRWSKKHKARNHGKSSQVVDDWRKKAADTLSSGWDVSEAGKSISKVKREEAKITAWENLQKAKAEAEIRKLEMKLEKKRSSSMDRIMNKLRSAQKRAQEMRSSVLANQAHQVSTNSHKVISFRRTRQKGSLSGCFTCHAF